MSKILITGVAGLVGSEAAKFYLNKGDNVIGVDNNMRATWFGPEADTTSVIKDLSSYPNFELHTADIASPTDTREFLKYFMPVDLVIHAAAQPSHDYAYEHPHEDFKTNALGTLNMLELVRIFSPEAVFVQLSTIKVYSEDGVNSKVLTDDNGDFSILESFLISSREGFTENLPIGSGKRSLFGVSKLAGDLLAQEYGLHYGIKTGIFRPGCITGRNHRGVEAHGFLSYLVKCIKAGRRYNVFGYNGNQIRDQLHVSDLVSAIDFFFQNPKTAAVYNIGGGVANAVSIKDAIKLIELKLNKKANVNFVDTPRDADHKVWISDNTKFQKDYPNWAVTKTLDNILDDLI